MIAAASVGTTSRLDVSRERMVRTAEDLARTEEKVACTFGRLALQGGERARQRQAIADEARQQAERLKLWALSAGASAPERHLRAKPAGARTVLPTEAVGAKNPR